MALATPVGTTRVVRREIHLPAVAIAASVFALILLLTNFVLLLGVQARLDAITTVRDHLVELQAEMQQVAAEQRQMTDALRRVANGPLSNVALRIEEQTVQLDRIAERLAATHNAVAAVRSDVRALRTSNAQTLERLAAIERILERERGTPATTADRPRSR